MQDKHDGVASHPIPPHSQSARSTFCPPPTPPPRRFHVATIHHPPYSQPRRTLNIVTTVTVLEGDRASARLDDKIRKKKAEFEEEKSAVDALDDKIRSKCRAEGRGVEGEERRRRVERKKLQGGKTSVFRQQVAESDDQGAFTVTAVSAGQAVPGAHQMEKQTSGDRRKWGKFKAAISSRSVRIKESPKKNSMYDMQYNDPLDGNGYVEEGEAQVCSKVQRRAILTGVFIIMVFTIAISVPISLKKRAIRKEIEEQNKEVDYSQRHEPIEARLVESWGNLSETVQRKTLDWIVQEDPRVVEFDDQTLIQRYILALLYFNNNGIKWITKKNWMTSESECQWDGVQCDENQMITTLKLNTNLLTKSIPRELGWLRSLKILNLGNNNLSGGIPVELYNLTQLEDLALDHNRLVGTLHSDIQYLQNLQFLNLGDNMFSGTVPESISNLFQLRAFLLFMNKFEGSIFDNLLPISNLTSIDIAENLFDGTLPPTISQLDKVQYLGLWSNKFSGRLPPEIVQITSLIHLHLSLNDFEGPIPEDIHRLTKLETLNLEENRRIRGRLPETIGNLTGLTWLNLGACSLTGSIPDGIGNLEQLTTLNLFSNYLTGEVPTGMGRMKNLRVALLHYNDLKGTMPEELCKLTEDKLKQLESDCKYEITCSCCTKCVF